MLTPQAWSVVDILQPHWGYSGGMLLLHLAPCQLSSRRFRSWFADLDAPHHRHEVPKCPEKSAKNACDIDHVHNTLLNGYPRAKTSLEAILICENIPLGENSKSNKQSADSGRPALVTKDQGQPMTKAIVAHWIASPISGQMIQRFSTLPYPDYALEVSLDSSCRDVP